MLDTSVRRFSAAVQPRRWAGVPGVEPCGTALSGAVVGDWDGLDVTEAAAKAGVTRQALHSWLDRYAEGGLQALAHAEGEPADALGRDPGQAGHLDDLADPGVLDVVGGSHGAQV